MAHVFIAYHRADLEAASRVYDRIESEGFTVWFNPMPDAGAAWFGWIDGAIRASFAMIVVVSDPAATPQATYEWAFALGAAIPVIPLVIGEGVTLPPALAVCDPIPFPEGDSWAAVIERVQKAVRACGGSGRQFPMGTPLSIARLEMLTDSFEAGERAAALDQLAVLDDPEALDALRRALTHAIFADVRRGAAQALGRLRDVDSVPNLCAALDEDDSTVFMALVTALAHIGAPAIPILGAVVAEGTRLQRRGAVLALSRITDGDPVPGLIAALGVRDWFVPRTAAVALDRIGDARAVRALAAAQRSDDPHLCALAARALEHLPQ